MIFHVGGHDKGALTAFDVNTGDVKWSWTGDGPGYGSPIVADDRRHAADHHDHAGRSWSASTSSTGTLLWERPFVSSNTTNSRDARSCTGRRVIVSGNGGPIDGVRDRPQGRDQWVAETAVGERRHPAAHEQRA